MCSITPKYIKDAVLEMADGQPGKDITIADLRGYAESCSSICIDELLTEDAEDLGETDLLACAIWRHCDLLERELSEDLEIKFSVK